MYMIEIETKEMEKASEYVEKALKYMGKVMQCISSWEDEAGYGNRYGMGERTIRHSGRMNYRDHEEWDDDEMNERYDEMGERRRRSRRTGRYI